MLEDRPAIDVENAWGLDATSYGNHEFDYGVERLLKQQAQANFPFLATNIVEEGTGKTPDWVRPSEVFKVNGVKVGVIGAGLQETPELVSAGASKGLTFLPGRSESRRNRNGWPQGYKVQIVVIHEGTATGSNAVDKAPGGPMGGPDCRNRRPVAGHHGRRGHRRSHPPGVEPIVGDILVTEGINAGASYSVLQLMVKGGDVGWAGGATRIARTWVSRRGPTSRRSSTTRTPGRPYCGTRSSVPRASTFCATPNRLNESAMGNMVTDAMRHKYPGVDAALTNSGGLRQNLRRARPDRRGATGTDHLG